MAECSKALWRRAAEVDLEETYLFIGRDDSAAAERWLDGVASAVRFLARNPGAGREVGLRARRGHGLRSWVMRDFPAYVIFYRVDGDRLDVLRVIHGARDVPRILGETR